MKKRTLFCLLSFVAFLGMDAQVYVLNDGNEYSVHTEGEKTIDLDGRPAGELTFDASKGGVAINPKLIVSQYVDGSWKNVATTSNLGGSYASFGPYVLDRKATRLKFKGSGTMYKNFKNIKVTMATFAEADAAELTLPTVEIGKSSTATFKLAYSNVEKLSASSSNPSVFYTEITSIEAGAGNYGEETITVTYTPTEVGTQSAVITFANGTQEVQVAVGGTAVKKAQQIIWKDNIALLPEGATVETPATATSGGEVLLASSDAGVVEVVGNTLVAHSAGKATITATQAGDDTEWDAVSDSKTVTVTALEVQTIVWEQDFYRLKLGDDPIALNATASSGLEVAYVSANPEVVAVEGSMLAIVGEGETVLTAMQAGNGMYAPASLEKLVRVRTVSGSCDEYVLLDLGEHNFSTEQEWETALDGRPAGELTFEAKTVPILGVGGGNLDILQLVNGSWSKVGTVTPARDSYTKYGPYTLDRAATKIKLDAPFGATGYKYFRNIIVSMASYFETDKPEIRAEVPVGTLYQNTLEVRYSDLPDLVEWSHVNGKIVIDHAPEFGDGCGDYGTEILNISVTPEAMGELLDTITLVAATDTLRVPIALQVRKRTQAIEWTQDLNDLVITDELMLTATATSGLPVSYVSDNEAVAVIEDGVLRFVGEGTATVTAMQTGNDGYNEAQPMTRTVTVTRLSPVVSEWPVASGIVYGQLLSVSTLTGGTADVAGTFAWVDGQIMPNGGTNSYDVVFTPENTAWYVPVNSTVELMVEKAYQEIMWEQDFSDIHVGDVVELTATTVSGAEVVYSIRADEENAGVASIEGNKLAALAVGAVDLVASVAETDNYNAAEEVVMPLIIYSEVTTGHTAAHAGRYMLYPNPSIDVCHLQSEEEMQEVCLFDLAGALVLRQQVQSSRASIDMGNLPCGMYQVLVRTASGHEQTLRVLKK